MNQFRRQAARATGDSTPIQGRWRDSKMTVIKAGRDLTAAEDVRAFLARCHRAIRAGGPRITLDLSAVELADTKIVAALIAAYQHALRSSVVIRVVPSEAVGRVMRLCRLENILNRLTATG